MEKLTSRSKKTKIIIFRPEDLRSIMPDRIAALNKKTNSELTAVTTWEELNTALAKGPDLLFFHTKLSKMFNISFSEFVTMASTLIKCIPTCNKNLKLAVVITKNTTQEEVAELKKLGVMGILPNADDFGFDQRATAQIEMIKGNEYWPEDVIDSLPFTNNKKTILLYQPDRYTKRFNSEQADAYFEEHIPCNFLVSTTWDDFVIKLDHNPDLVGFHSDLFNNEEISTRVMIRTIETTLTLKNKKSDIFVALNKKANREMIDLLRKTNIIGLQFGRGDFGIEYAAESYRRLLEDRYHWPEDKISMLLEHQENKKPLHIYFRDDMDTYIRFDPELNNKIKNGVDANINVQLCKSWDNLSSGLAERPKNITFHIDMVRRHGGTIAEFMMMLDTMIKYADLPVRPNITVGIEADTHLSTIKELQKHRILGIAPSAKSFGVEYTIAAIKDFINDTPHWPKDIIARLPGNEPKTKNKTSHSLTGRQQEVFDLIARRGLSNKQIARVLNISESTVKIHVSAVMKNLCVRNRTQLALTK